MSAQLKIPCLGRPFNLGMLYDCHHAKLIPGKTLWDSLVLKSALQTSAQPSSDFEIITEDSLHKKCQSLDIEGDLKLSILGGILEVRGAAKFMNDQTSSQRQSRVTLKYSCTTRFEQLTMEQLGSIQYPQVLDDLHATHVVTGVMYGADAFFVFDRNVGEKETVKSVNGNMEAQISLIPTGGSASVDSDQVDKTETVKFRCKFHGDLILPSNPSTYNKAVQVCRDLPKLLKLNCDTGDESVPKNVYLHPLSELDGKPEQVVRSISRELISQVEDIMESFHQVEIQCNDLKNSDLCSKFANQKDQISTFSTLVNRFKMDFVIKLFLLLPKIRGLKAEEQELAEFISLIFDSPFCYKHMEKYLKCKGREIKLLSQYLKNIEKNSNIQFDFPTTECDLVSLTADDEMEYVVCFAFNIISDTMQGYIKNLDSFLRTQKTSFNSSEWFKKSVVFDNLKSKLRAYTDFVTANCDTKRRITFVVTDHSEDMDHLSPAIILYHNDSCIEFEPPGKPGTPEIVQSHRNNIVLTWTKPDHGSAIITSYRVLYRSSSSEGISQYQSIVTKDSETIVQIENLSPGVLYDFQVQAVCGPGVSVSSGICTTETESPLRPADLMKVEQFCIQKGTPSIFRLPVKTVSGDDSLGLFKKSIGSPTSRPERVLMLVGATGAGKTTLINGIANYILGVEWKDDFRFKVISDEGKQSQIHSQTKSITAYTFHSTNMSYDLTIIDTPGFGDTSGIEGDKRIEQQIKHFFSTRGNVCIDQLHGIGFVTQAGLARLTPTQKYVFHAVFSIFSKDIADNIFLMATFADANTPPVLEATKEAGIPYKKSFKFNNSALFASNKGEDINSMFWIMGHKSLKDFFGHFSKAEARSLVLTREVLREREQLESLIPGLQQQVRVGLSHLDEIQQEERALRQHEAEITANEDFIYHVDVTKFRKHPLPNTVTTTCLQCNFTCHENCAYSNDGDKYRCCAMDVAGNCTVCPKNCHWDEHANLPFHIEYYTERESRTSDDLKKRYETAKTGKEKVKSMIVKNEGILHNLQAYVFSVIDNARRSIKRLNEIALKPNPLSEIEYLDLLIESEQIEAKTGWKTRVNQYKKMRKNAEVLKKVQGQQISTKDPRNTSWWKFW